MAEPKANQRETLKFSVEELRRFAPRLNERQLSEFVLKACDHYARYLKRQRGRDAR